MQGVIIDPECPIPQAICPSCLSQWVYPDVQTPGQWDCEECGWTGLDNELLHLDPDGELDQGTGR